MNLNLRLKTPNSLLALLSSSFQNDLLFLLVRFVGMSRFVLPSVIVHVIPSSARGPHSILLDHKYLVLKDFAKILNPPFLSTAWMLQRVVPLIISTLDRLECPLAGASVKSSVSSSVLRHVGFEDTE